MNDMSKFMSNNPPRSRTKISSIGLKITHSPNGTSQNQFMESVSY